MRNMMKKLLTKGKRQHNRGFSLVEVVCAVAILGILSATIGGIIVMSARSYRNGLSETGVQQEAQMAINNIGNIIKDACSVKYGEPSGKIWLDGEETVDDFANTNTELSIITNEKMQYSITYTPLTRNLQYQEFDVETGSAVTNQQIIATNVVNFKADTSNFKDARAVTVKMDVEDPDTGRTIPLEYTMKSRNDIVSGMKFLSTSDDVAIIFLETDIVLVPGETYAIPITVVGNLTEGLELDSSENANMGALTLDYVEVSIPRDTTADTATLTIRTKDKKADGSFKDRATANIKIRRVDSISVSHTVDRSSVTGGTYEGKDAVYTFTANASGPNLPQVPGAAFDSGRYKKAQAVFWSLELQAEGNTYHYSWSFDAGTNTYTHSYDNQTEMEKYVKIMDSPGPQEDVDRPSISVKLMQNMPSDFNLKVIATSKHALGVNKADSRYPDDTTVKEGYEIITPRETVMQNAEITLEPNETGVVDTKMLGGIANSMRCDLRGNSDSLTSAVYVIDKSSADYGKVRITLGKDEKGSGYRSGGGSSNYTFYVDLYPDAATDSKATITVHVCRIDEISIEVFDEFTDKEGAAMGTPTYDFRGRINVTDGKNDSNAVLYLIQYKEDGSVDTSAVPNTLASRITWELIDNKTNITLKKDSVICKAGVGAGNSGEIIGSYTKNFTYNNNDIYTVVNVKPARIEQRETGEWYLKQMPEIDISTNSKTDTGLPADTELKVTIEMLHPRDGDNSATNSYNKSNKPYKDNKVMATESIKGTQSLYTDEQIIVVEPNQGTDQTAQSDTEMVIPIKVSGGGVYKMNAKVETGKGVRISNYKDENGEAADNPYVFSSAAGGGERTWLLGLVVGKDADGLIDVTVEGLNTSNKVIATTTFQLAVRRVNKVDVKVKDGEKITDVNTAGNVVTLEAYPTGVDGTKYYDVQKDENGNIYRWEQAGHGEYKSPIPMKWSIVINGQEKPIEQWSEYIATGTVRTGVNETDYKSTVTFQLVQSLPDGAEIRATSLHALGAVDGTKYNKSGEKYDDKYGSLKISNEIIDPDDPFEDDEIEFLSGVKRGQDYFFSYDYLSESPDNANTQNQNYLRDMNYAYQNDCHWFWRVREITSIDGTDMTFGEWTEYRKCKEESRDNKKLNAEETRSLRPDMRYQVELALLCISKDNKTLYWPYDSSVIANGTGFEGYRIGWDSSKKTTPKEDYAQTFNIGRASLAFQSGTIPRTGYEESVTVNIANNGVNYAVCYKTYGTFEHPLSLKNGDTFSVSLTGYALESGHYQNGTLARVQKLQGNTWVEVNASTICETIEDRKLQPLIKNIKGNAKGTYRVSFKLDTYDIYYWDETSSDPVWNPQYRQSAQSQQYLLCGSNGSAGYIYFTIE